MDKYLYHSANYKRQFNDNAFYNKIIVMVGQKLGRELSNPEMQETVSFIKKLDPDLLKPRYRDKTIKIMVTTLTDEFKKYDCTKPLDDDTQQILRSKIGISSESGTSHGIYDDPSYYLRVQQAEQTRNKESATDAITNGGNTTINLKNLLGLKTSEEAVRVLNPDSLLRKNFILLDSRYRILTTNDTGGITSFSWNYILKSQIEAQGSVNIIGNVRDIVALRVYPFRIPYVSSADNKYSRISVFIEELGSQAFIAHEDRKFHFLLKSQIDSDFINLETNKYNDGFYYFEKPITTLNRLTISFGSPLEKIIFDIDRSWVSIDYFTNAPLTTFTTYSNNKLSTSPLPHNLSNGDRVYFELFKTGFIDPALTDQVQIDADIKEAINREEGWLITVVSPGPLANSFTIPFDSSNIQSPITDIRFRCFFGSKRIFLPIEISYIMPQVDPDAN